MGAVPDQWHLGAYQQHRIRFFKKSSQFSPQLQPSTNFNREFETFARGYGYV
jgi:hypothetical protein